MAASCRLRNHSHARMPMPVAATEPRDSVPSTARPMIGRHSSASRRWRGSSTATPSASTTPRPGEQPEVVRVLERARDAGETLGLAARVEAREQRDRLVAGDQLQRRRGGTRRSRTAASSTMYGPWVAAEEVPAPRRGPSRIPGERAAGSATADAIARSPVKPVEHRDARTRTRSRAGPTAATIPTPTRGTCRAAREPDEQAVADRERASEA